MNCAYCPEYGRLGDLMFTQQCAPRTHQSVCEFFKGILEFIGRQLVDIFVDPPYAAEPGGGAEGQLPPPTCRQGGQTVSNAPNVADLVE